MKETYIKNKLYEILGSQLSPNLSYHSIRHTIDVHNVCKFYIDHYEIGTKEAALLEIAAVGHDVGFIEVYANHEQVGAEITSTLMKKNGFKVSERELVSDLILATKIPQSPGSFLAQMICDADLDYLGRDDFAPISQTLKQEWSNYEIVPNLDEDFDHIQIGFLKSHFYHTDFAAEHRNPIKLINLQAIEERQKKKVNKVKIESQAESA